MIVAVLLVACSSAADLEGTTTTITAPTTTRNSLSTSSTGADSPATSMETPTTTTATPTTTTGDAVYRVASTELSPPAPMTGVSDGASGSGCSPGPGLLPDGIWFGLAMERGETIEFDLACLYFGDIAWEKAAEVGEEAPNDVWIVNDSSVFRSQPLADGIVVWAVTGDASEGLMQITYQQWLSEQSTYTMCPGSSCPVWLYVNSGVATEIAEQYFP